MFLATHTHRGRLAFFLALVCAVAVPALASISGDADGSLDLDLSLQIGAPGSSPVGSDVSVTLSLANGAASEGAAFDLGVVLYLPDGLSLVSSTLGDVILESTDPMTGVTTVAIEGTAALAPGDSLQRTVTLRPATRLEAGAVLALRGVAYADDSPFERGAAPPTEPSARYGGVDLSYPSAEAATEAADHEDDAAITFPALPVDIDESHLSQDSFALSLFDLRVTPLVAEGERATGTTTNAYSTRIRLIGNGQDAVSEVVVRDVLSANREFLGFVSVPEGTRAVAYPNVPDMGQVTLEISGVTIPAGSSVDIVYRSGIAEYELKDATNAFTSPADEDPASPGARLVQDGGDAPGRGERATDLATALSAFYRDAPVDESLLPAPASASVEAEYVAITKSVDLATRVIGDTVTYTLTLSVSEYADAGAPLEIVDVLPDGLRFDGAASVRISSEEGTELTFDEKTGIADPATGDTLLRFVLAEESRLPAGGTATIRYTATVDGAFEGPGEVDFEVGETLTNQVRVDATLADEGSTDESLIGFVSADDSSATIGTPKPALRAALVSVTTSGGTVYDGTPKTPNFDPLRDVARPGSTLRFAVIADFPGVPTLGARLDDFLPLLTGPSTSIEAVSLNAATDLVDIAGASIPANDGDGDGSADESFAGFTAPLEPQAGGFPSPELNNSLRFGLGEVRPYARLVILVDARITNEVPQPIPTDGLVLTRNVAMLSYASDTGVPLDTLTAENEFSIGLPFVTLTKTRIDTGGEDAGNLLRFQLRLANEGHSPAFVDDLVDTLPAQVALLPATLTVTDGSLRPIEHVATYDESANTIRVAFRSGSGLHPNYLPHADAEAEDGDHVVLVTYEVRVDAETLPGTTLVNEAITNYFSAEDAPTSEAFGPLEASASLKLATASVVKTVVATSAAHTTGTNVTIGETVTYRVEARFPEGVVADAVIQDRLPSGLALVSAQVLSIDAQLGTNGGTNEPVMTTGDFRDKDGVLDGVDFALGTVTSPASESSSTRTIVIEVVARVMNVASNTQSKNLSNVAYLYAGKTRLATGSRSVKVQLPVPAVTKTASDTLLDAGDEFTYTIRAAHAAGSPLDAFDAVIEDVLPDGISLVSHGSVRASGGASGVSALSGAGTAQDPLRVSATTMPRGSAVEFDVRVVISGSFEALETVTNTATASFRTLPGQNPDAGTSTKSGSHALTMANVAVEKALIATQFAETGATSATIGERITYRLAVTIPEGSARNLVVKDTLAPGLAFVEGSTVSLDGALRATVANPAASTPAPGVVAWNFGTVVNEDRDDSRDETIVIEYGAIVTNVAGNAIGGTVVNAVVAEHANGVSTTATHQTPLVAPELLVRAVFDEKYGRAGDRVRLVYEVWHASSSPFTAYDVDVVTELPKTLALAGSLETINGPEARLDESGLPGRVRVVLGDLDLEVDRGNPATFALEFVLDETFDGSLVEFPVTARWSTLAGDPGVLVEGSATAVERTGDTTDAGGLANDLRTTYDAVFDDYSTFLLGFEDLGHVRSFNDFDYNDVLLDVDTDERYDESGHLTHLRARVELLARGAAFDHRLELRLGVKGPANVVMTRYDALGGIRTVDRWHSDGEFIDDAILLYSTTQALPAWSMGSAGFATNTAADQSEAHRRDGFVTEIEVEVLDPSRNPEIPDLAATPLVNEHIRSLYGFNLFVWSLSEDVSAAGVGRNSTQSLVTAENFPGSPLDGYPLDQTLVFPRSAKWPVERTPIWEAYPEFVRLITSGGGANRAWFVAPAAADTWPAGAAPLAMLADATSAAVAEDADAPSFASAPVLASSATATTEEPALKLDSAGATKSRISRIRGRSIGGVRPPLPSISEIRASLATTADGHGPMPAAALASEIDGSPRLVVASYFGDVTIADPISGETTESFRMGGGARSQAPIAIGDLDGDGGVDLVRGFEDGTLWRTDLETFATALLVDTTSPIKSGAVLADLDGDASVELVFMGGDGALYALRGNGTAVPGFPLALSTQKDVGSHFFFTSTPAAIDLDGDATVEIVTGTLDGKVYAVNAAGEVLEGWPYAMTGPVLSRIAAGALYEGGAPAIVATDNNGVLVALDASGTPLPGWPVQPAFAGGTASPVIADLDGDRRHEIVVGGVSGLVHAFDHSGNERRGWPVQLAGSVFGAPAVGNFDADRGLEVAVGSSDGRLTLIDSDGVDGWLEADGRAWALRTGGMIAASPLAADVDEDGLVEVTIPSYDGLSYIVKTEGAAQR